MIGRDLCYDLDSVKKICRKIVDLAHTVPLPTQLARERFWMEQLDFAIERLQQQIAVDMVRRVYEEQRWTPAHAPYDGEDIEEYTARYWEKFMPYARKAMIDAKIVGE